MASQKLRRVDDERFSFDEENGAVRSFFGSELVGPAEAEAALDLKKGGRALSPDIRAAIFLESNKDEFKLDRISLSAPETTEGNATRSVRYVQEHQGIEVYEAELVVGFRTSDNRIISTVNHLDYKLPEDLGLDRVRLTADEAGHVIERRLGPIVKGIEITQPARLFVYRHSDETQNSPPRGNRRFWEEVTSLSTGLPGQPYLVWQVITDVEEPSGNWEILVDAIDGSIIAVFDRRRYQQPIRAYVFMPDPITSSENAKLTWSMDDALNAQLVPVSLKDLDPPDLNGKRRLRGVWVRCVDRNKPDFEPPDFDGEFAFKSKEPEFLYGMAYYWLNELIAYLRGFKIETFNAKTTTPFEADAIGEDRYENSHFVTTRGKPFISFGDGGVPDASDAHVIVHEYGHALHHFLDKQHDYEEGFCDFLAGAWLDRFNTKGFQRELVFPWDNNKSINWDRNRRFNLTQRFSDIDFRYYTRHLKGSVFAAALWKLFIKIGGNDPNPAKRIEAADTVIRLYLDMLITVSPNSKAPELAKGMMEADRNSQVDPGKYRTAIWEAFKDRGLWTGNPPPIDPPPPM